MKKITTLLTALSISAMSQAQITLENSYPAQSNKSSMYIVNLNAGCKYIRTDNYYKTITLYDLNHSVFKNIPLSVPAGYTLLTSGNVSDGLFNTDPAVELSYTYYNYIPGTPPVFNLTTKIIDENGSALLVIPSCSGVNVVNTGTATGYKMIATIDSSDFQVKSHDIYSLVGTLPVVTHPTDPNNPTSLVTNNPDGPFMSSAIPNPSQNKTTVAYQLPEGTSTAEIAVYDINGKEIKRFTVDRTFSSLELDNTDLPSGTYLYQLITAGGKSSTKKMIVIK